MRGRFPRWWLVSLAVCGGSAVTAAAASGADAGVAEAARVAATTHAGIWKAVVPPRGSMHGEFDSNDPLGVAAGTKIAADCSINWVDPDAGKLYCFSSATSLVLFLEGPHAWLERARTGWRRLGDGAP